MTRYLISFDAHAMDHVPGEEMPAVAKAAQAVVQEVLNAGVLVFTLRQVPGSAASSCASRPAMRL